MWFGIVDCYFRANILQLTICHCPPPSIKGMGLSRPLTICDWCSKIISTRVFLELWLRIMISFVLLREILFIQIVFISVLIILISRNTWFSLIFPMLLWIWNDELLFGEEFMPFLIERVIIFFSSRWLVKRVSSLWCVISSTFYE